jgi:hypothetical protein
MSELGWVTSKVTEGHLQNLMTQGYMTTAELETCHVPEYPASLVPVMDKLVSCMLCKSRYLGWQASCLGLQVCHVLAGK